MAISKRLRFEIFRRDNFTCRYCGLHAGENGAELTVDHVVPVALGGQAEPSNLVTACKDCNAGKSSMPADAPLIQNVAQDALRWGRAMAMAALALEAERERRDAYRQEFIKVWNTYTVTAWDRGAMKSVTRTLDMPADAMPTVDRFYAAGLPAAEMADAIDIAMSARNVKFDDVLRYFAGICWKRVTTMQDAARALLGSGQVD